MLEYHTTGDGRTLLIAQMTDKHLGNTVNLLFRRVAELRDLAEVAPSMSPFSRALYGVTEINPEEAGRVVAQAVRKLYPYIAELVLRGNNTYIEDTSDNLRQIMERTGPLSLQAVAELPEPVDHDDDDWGRHPIDHEDLP